MTAAEETRADDAWHGGDLWYCPSTRLERIADAWCTERGYQLQQHASFDRDAVSVFYRDQDGRNGEASIDVDEARAVNAALKAAEAARDVDRQPLTVDGHEMELEP